MLRSYPLREADLLVTRSLAWGRCAAWRGRPKNRNDDSVELWSRTYVRAFYDVRERQDLARWIPAKVLESPMASEVSYPRAWPWDTLPSYSTNCCPTTRRDAIFRLTLSVLHVLTGPDVGCGYYFELWLTDWSFPAGMSGALSADVT